MKIAGVTWDWNDRLEARELNRLLEVIGPNGVFVDAYRNCSDSYGLVCTNAYIDSVTAGDLLETMAFWNKEVWETSAPNKLLKELRAEDERQNTISD